MTPYDRRLNPYINRMAQDMQICNLAASAVDSYTWHVEKFCSHVGKMPEEQGLHEKLYVGDQQHTLGATSQPHHRTLSKRFAFAFTACMETLAKCVATGSMRSCGCGVAGRLVFGGGSAFIASECSVTMPIETNASKGCWTAADGSSVASCREISVSLDRILVNRETLRTVCPTKTAKSQTRSSLFGVIPVQ